jgi:plastocyanin
MAAAALAVAGCGADEHKPSRTETVPAGSSVEVTADEYSFDPGRIVAAPGELRVTLRNGGSLAHDLRVRRNGSELGGAPVITAGKTSTASLSLPAGDYEFFCSVGDHEKLGMLGELEVR